MGTRKVIYGHLLERIKQQRSDAEATKKQFEDLGLDASDFETLLEFLKKKEAEVQDALARTP